MYFPSLFNAALVARLGLQGLVATGVAANFAACVIGLVGRPYFGLYVVELGLFGIGWNFMFNGGTLLLASSYAPAEKAKAQGLNSLLVYGANVVASLSAGALMAQYDWPMVSLACIPLLAGSALRIRRETTASGIAARSLSVASSGTSSDSIVSPQILSLRWYYRTGLHLKHGS